MQSLRHLGLLLTIACVSLTWAADPAQATDYKATVSGVVCAACKEHVTVAFKKLPGVENVSFARGDKEGTAVVTFNSSSPALTKADAVKALGDEAKNYEIVSLEKNR